MIGSLHGVNLPNPRVHFTIVSVKVTLRFVADLTRGTTLKAFGITVQELTGDWEGYRQRKPNPPRQRPFFPSDVPTQNLGHALNRIPLLRAS